MNYVEWLRVRRALKITLICLGALLAIGGVARVATWSFWSNSMLHISSLLNDKDSHVTHLVLPNGSKETIVDNPRERVHVTIVDNGYAGKHIEIMDRSAKPASGGIDYAGATQVRVMPVRGGKLTVVDTNAPTFVGDYAVFGAIVAMILATCLGAPLARENDGHLEIAATKPRSREFLALQALLTDAGGIVLAFVIGVAFAFVLHAIFQEPAVSFTPGDGLAVAIAVLGSLAWYAMLAAATASLHRGYGTIVGFAWPGALIVVAVALLVTPVNALTTALHYVFVPLSYLDPLRYLNLEASTNTGRMIVSPHAYFEPTMLAVLTLVYSALAILQWRRVEA
ncbi:MAG TPA: hypothetical protein VMH02_02160 [Verrucomicrobiae bacterium]|nr:hypothetical protein [Verrucomicrobiae bacterium]